MLILYSQDVPAYNATRKLRPQNADVGMVKFASMVVAVFAARFFAVAIFFPENGDLGWQRRLGGVILQTGRLPRSLGAETFTAPGAPWVPQEWLFSIAAYLSQGAWWYFFAGLCALCATAALLISSKRATLGAASPVAIAVAVSFAGVALLESFGVRAQVIAWPFVAVFLFFLELDSAWMYWAIGVVAIWSNVHASVMIAPALACVFCLGSFLEKAPRLRTRRLCYITLASLAATCANPLGFDLPRYAVSVFSSPFKSVIVEWQHTDVSTASFAFGSLPLLLIFALFGIDGPRRWSERLLVLSTALLMFSARRNIPMFAIACFPVAARCLSSNFLFLSRAGSTNQPRRPETKLERRTAALAPIFAVIVSVVVGAALVSRSRSEKVSNADLKPALAAIVALPHSHNVFCADFTWCSFLIFEGGHDRVFMDGRADPYPVAVWNDNDSIVWLKPGWDAILHHRKADVVLVDVASSLEQALELSPEWSSVYRNAAFRVWITQPVTYSGRRR